MSYSRNGINHLIASYVALCNVRICNKRFISSCNSLLSLSFLSFYISNIIFSFNYMEYMEIIIMWDELKKYLCKYQRNELRHFIVPCHFTLMADAYCNVCACVVAHSLQGWWNVSIKQVFSFKERKRASTISQYLWFGKRIDISVIIPKRS